MFYSVRARLTLWYTGILALVLVTFSGISYVLLAREIRESTDASLAGAANEFTGAFTNAPGNGSTTRDVVLDFRYSDRDIMIFTTGGQLVAWARSHLHDPDRVRIAAVVRKGFRGFATMAGGVGNDGIRLYATPINVVGMQHVVVVAHDLHEQVDHLEGAAEVLFLAIPLALLVAAGGGYVLARKSLAPVATMSLKARQIGAETLTERIAVANERDELGFLATTLNELLERLQRAFESQRSFMADASHELRTPLAIIQGESDVALSRKERTAAEYRESISVIQTSVRKLTRIVESLFLLARSDAGRYPITRSRFYLDELLSDCVRAMQSVASTRNVRLTCHGPAELVIVADEGLLHRMLLNLIDNALKFTPAGGSVRVEWQADGDRYVIRVVDSGIGVAVPDRARIFERFYRGERTRSARGVTPGSVSTGAGLGLPIARWIAEVHGGELSLEKSDAEGSTFIAIVPRGETAPPVEEPAQVASSV
jgi:heavy metal sensor kinase